VIRDQPGVLLLPGPRQTGPRQTRVPQPGAPQPGAPQLGAPQLGAPQPVVSCAELARVPALGHCPAGAATVMIMPDYGGGVLDRSAMPDTT
jgi:hypothetical protein